MHYLYGLREGRERKLVATFDSEQQLLSYVRWATLEEHSDGTRKFEQQSALVGSTRFEHSREPMTDEDETQVTHGPTPTML